MKVWKIPQEHLGKLDQWRERVLRFKIHGFALVEKLTGIAPVSLCKSGNLSFIPPVETQLPPYFTTPSEPYGLISPKRNSKKGKSLWKVWEEANIQPITTIHLFIFLGIELPSGPFSYGLDEIGGETYLVRHDGWKPEDYGYTPVEI